MKTKFLRILLMFACLVLLVANLNIDNAFATWKIEDNELVIQNEQAGNLIDNFSSIQRGKYTSLIITGEIDDYDFMILESMARNCSIIDLSAAQVDMIPDNAFSRNGSIKKFILPESLKIIGKGAFYWCNNLQIDKLPSNLETIMDYAFQYCEKLTISVSSRVAVGEGAFRGCPYVCLTGNTKDTTASTNRPLSLFVSYIVELFHSNP